MKIKFLIFLLCFFTINCAAIKTEYHPLTDKKYRPNRTPDFAVTSAEPVFPRQYDTLGLVIVQGKNVLPEELLKKMEKAGRNNGGDAVIKVVFESLETDSKTKVPTDTMAAAKPSKSAIIARGLLIKYKKK